MGQYTTEAESVSRCVVPLQRLTSQLIYDLDFDLDRVHGSVASTGSCGLTLLWGCKIDLSFADPSPNSLHFLTEIITRAHTASPSISGATPSSLKTQLHHQARWNTAANPAARSAAATTVSEPLRLATDGTLCGSSHCGLPPGWLHCAVYPSTAAATWKRQLSYLAISRFVYLPRHVLISGQQVATPPTKPATAQIRAPRYVSRG